MPRPQNKEEFRNGTVDYKTLESMVREVNANEVSPEDRLSNKVYHYDVERGAFEKAESYSRRMHQEKNMER